MLDAPRWTSANATLIARICVAVVALTTVLQFVEIGDGESPWIPLAAMYLSAALIGLDAVARGVRKRRGVGPSIVNLAPGGWAVFVAMFWAIAVPAYYIGARRAAPDDAPREPVTAGSWVAIGTFAVFGLVLLLVGATR